MNISKELTKRKWNALTEVKRFLEMHTKEKIISFNGYQLITKNYVFGLANGVLSIRDNKNGN